LVTIIDAWGNNEAEEEVSGVPKIMLEDLEDQGMW
jgi:hypothetical protein